MMIAPRDDANIIQNNANESVIALIIPYAIPPKMQPAATSQSNLIVVFISLMNLIVKHKISNENKIMLFGQ